VSEPVKSQFGFALMRAVDIEPEKVKAFSEVVDDLKRELATERARAAARSLADKVEDERTSGKALADAAKPLNLTAVSVETDAQGLDQQGKDVAMPEREALLRAVFASDVGVDNDHLTTRDGSYIWFEVRSVDPSRERRLDEVKDQVVAAWKDEEVNKRLSAKATDIVTALKAGQSIEAAAKAANATVKREDKVGRLQASSLPEGAVARVFGLPIGEIGSASGADQSRIIFKILSSEVPPIDTGSDAMKSIGDQLRSAMAEDLVSQYLAALQLQLGVKINEPAVRAATGGGDANTF
jgi:peptidyl-prolyl cis-trans isomerase D